jgi:hypothetical protein
LRIISSQNSRGAGPLVGIQHNALSERYVFLNEHSFL